MILYNISIFIGFFPEKPVPMGRNYCVFEMHSRKIQEFVIDFEEPHAVQL